MVTTKNNWNDFKQEMKAVMNRRVDAYGIDSPSIPSSPSTPPSLAQPKRPIYLVALLVLAVTLGIVIFAQYRTRDVVATEPQQQTQVKVNEMDVVNKIKGFDNAVRVLGMAHNNNWYTLYQNKPAGDIVYIDPNWKMNHRPPNVTVKSELDEKFLSDWSN